MIRQPAFAGAFYPADKIELTEIIKHFLADANPPSIDGRLRALISPHAGYIYSGPVAAFGYKLLKEQKVAIRRIFLLGPSHQFPIERPTVGDFASWQTSLGKIRVADLPVELSDSVEINNQVQAGEHSLEVQLPFLQVVLGPNFQIIPILLNQYSSIFADRLVNLIADDDLIIASSDLSHYYSYDQAVQLDQTTNDATANLDIAKLKSDGEACGIEAIATVLAIAREKNWQAKLLKYQNSGDTAGDKSQVVGYGSFEFYNKNND